MCFVVIASNHLLLCSFGYIPFPKIDLFIYLFIIHLLIVVEWNSESFKCQTSILHWATPWAETYFIFKTKTYHYQLVFRRTFSVIVFVMHLLIAFPRFPVTVNSGCYHHYHYDIILDPNYDRAFLWWYGVFFPCVGWMWMQRQSQCASWEASSQRKKTHVCMQTWLCWASGSCWTKPKTFCWIQWCPGSFFCAQYII